MNDQLNVNVVQISHKKYYIYYIYIYVVGPTTIIFVGTGLFHYAINTYTFTIVATHSFVYKELRWLQS